MYFVYKSWINLCSVLFCSNGSEIPLTSILELFVDTFVSFLKMEGIIISIWIENIVVFGFTSDNS